MKVNDRVQDLLGYHYLGIITRIFGPVAPFHVEVKWDNYPNRRYKYERADLVLFIDPNDVLKEML